MTDIEYKNTLFEVSIILKHLDRSLIEKIPQSVIDDIELNKSKDYIFNYDLTKSLSNQKMLTTTEQYLSILYLRFLASKDERKEVLGAIKENDKKNKIYMNEHYNPNYLFNNRTMVQVDESKDNSVDMIKYEEFDFKRHIKKFKNLLKEQLKKLFFKK